MDYRILARVGGANPLTDQPFPRRIGSHIMAIGTLGGRVKPSSGYAFMRIQRDSAAIVRSLLRTGHPVDVPSVRPSVYRVVESLVAIAEGHGVQFRYNTLATQITVDGDHATGVILPDGSHLEADVIVANADLPYVYRHLLPDRAAADHLERLRYTCSAIMFYWGIDRVYPHLGPHCVFLAGDYRAGFERIFTDHALPDEPSFYIHAPARIDPSAASPGREMLLALVPVGHLDAAATQDWDAWRAQARSTILRRLAGIGVADLDKHITVEVSYTARDWLTLYNLAKGAAFSPAEGGSRSFLLSHNALQVGYLRPHNRHRRYGNLYFVGGSTHPGSGLPMVLLSARLAAERILAEVTAPHNVRDVPALVPRALPPAHAAGWWTWR